jgi:SAM-dependent methyltransferase
MADNNINPIDIKQYSDNYINEQQNEGTFERILMKARRKQIYASYTRHNPKNILEIGCGIEPFFLNCDSFSNYVIIEPSEELAKNAKSLSHNKGNITIINSYLNQMDLNFLLSLKFDLIIISSVLHLIPNLQEFLKNLYHICTPQTIIHINVPNNNSFHRLLAYEMGLISDPAEKSARELKFQRLHSFNKKILFNLLQENNFQVLMFETYFVKLFSNDQMGKLLEYNIVDKSVIEGLDKMIKYMPDLGCEMYIEAKIKC